MKGAEKINLYNLPAPAEFACPVVHNVTEEEAVRCEFGPKIHSDRVRELPVVRPEADQRLREYHGRNDL